jgi:stringent starvation protein B
VAVLVDDNVRVPREYVKNGEIVLNISFDATSSLKLGNEFIEFKARFAGTPREILVPVANVIAIYARENGQGMAFPMSVPVDVDPNAGDAQGSDKPAELGETNVVQLVHSDADGADAHDGPEPPQAAIGSSADAQARQVVRGKLGRVWASKIRSSPDLAQLVEQPPCKR